MMNTHKQTYRNILACIIGNVLEWYEFSLFAYLSPIIANLFFPTQNSIAGLLSTLLVFAAGFVIRPLGSILLGHMGDKLGRARTLKFTLLLLSFSSICTGFLPTYQSIGILSPLLLILCRLVQGFCIGGEFAGSMIYLSESAPSKHRAFISAMSNNGSNLGVLIAVLTCTLTSSWLSAEDMAHYGWRILFISGGVLGLLGLWLRRDLRESETFHRLQKNINETYLPIQYVLKFKKKQMFLIFLLLFSSACGSYTLMGYLSTYLHEFLAIPLSQAYQLQTFFILLSLILLPFFARLSDKFGRKNIFIFSSLGYLIFSFPIFSLLGQGQSFLLFIPLILFYSAEQAVTPVLMVEMFPGKGRFTGLSLSYNLAMALVGGFSPAINTALIHYFDNTMIIAYYIFLTALVSLFIGLKCLPKTYGLRTDLSLAQ